MKTISFNDYKQTQFGKVVDMNNIENDMEEYAEVFSEGSPALRRLLLYLWNQGIKTKACCTGHMFKPAFHKKILWFEKPITEQEYIRNQEKKNYSRYLISYPGYFCFYYESNDMMKSAHALRDTLSQKCPTIKFHVSFSYEEISVYLDEVLYPQNVEKFFELFLEAFVEWNNNQ